MKKKKIVELIKMSKKKKLKTENNKGITLVSLVVTIIVLIILTGISINLVLGENGILKKAIEARKAQKIGEVKERLSLEIAGAETEAILRNEKLEQKQLEDIINKYGILKEDKDTIVTKEGNYEISLKEIWYGVLSESGSYSDKVEQVELLEKEIADLKKKYEELENLNHGNSELLDNLKSQIQYLEEEKNNLGGQITKLETEKEELRNNLEEAQMKNMELEKSLEEVQNKKIFKNYGSVSSGNIANDFQNYKKMTASNFYIVVTNASATPGRVGGNSGTSSGNVSPKVTYDANTGNFSVSNTSISASTSGSEVFIRSLSLSFQVICIDN